MTTAAGDVQSSAAAAAAAHASNNNNNNSSSAAATQVTVRFVTRLPLEYRVPDEPVTVPTNLARYGLSQIINHLLGRGDGADEEEGQETPEQKKKKSKKTQPVVPFDFLVGGELVRGSLEALLQRQRASAETAVVVEYFLAVPPPEPRTPAPAGDWVDALVAIPSSSSGPFVVAAGCCDGGVRLWSRRSLLAGAGADADGERAGQRHAGGVDALALMQTTSAEGGEGRSILLSSGRDGIARASLLPENGGSDGGDNDDGADVDAAVVVVAELRGHADSVASVAACPASSSSSSSFAATGCWDGTVRLWRLAGDAAVDAAIARAAAARSGRGGAAAAAAKRRKLSQSSSSSAAASSPSVATPDPLLTISNGGHTQCVSSICWPARGALLTASWDHSVRRWDVGVDAAVGTDDVIDGGGGDGDDEEAFPPAPASAATCVPTETFHAGHAVFALASPRGGDGRLVALGGASRDVRLWDCRVSASSSLSSSSSSRLGSHGDWVSALAWHPSRDTLVASAGHDGAVKLWDTRGGRGGGGDGGGGGGNVTNGNKTVAAAPPLAVLAAHDGKALALSWCLGGTGMKDLLVSGGADGRVRAFEVAA